MNLPNPIECSGYFWHPSDHKTRLPGILRISKSGYCELQLIKLFEQAPLQLGAPTLGAPIHSDYSFDHNRIVGIIKFDKSSQPVTLLNCFYSTYDLSAPLGISTSIIVTNTALIGVMYEHDKAISLSEYRFSFSGLDEWLQSFDSKITRESVEGREIPGALIQYVPPEVKSYRLSNGMRVEINFDLSIPMRVGSAESKIVQKSFISIKSDTLLPLDAFFSMTWKLQTFACLCIDASVVFDSSVGYSTDFVLDFGESQTSEKPIHIYYKSALRTETEGVVSPYDMLITFRDMESQFENAINCWIDQYEECESIFDLYAYTRWGTRTPSNEDAFLSFSQSLESLHRVKFPNSTIPDEEYENLVGSMLNVLPEDRREFFEGKLKFGNEPSFANRIRELLEPFEKLFVMKETPKRFIRRIVDTRNFYTHFTKELRSKSASGAELVYLKRNLEALLQLHLLRLIGIDSGTIEMISKENHRLRQKLIVSGSG